MFRRTQLLFTVLAPVSMLLVFMITPTEGSAQTCWICDQGLGGWVCAGQEDGKTGANDCENGWLGGPMCFPSGGVCNVQQQALRMSGQIVPDVSLSEIRESANSTASIKLCDGSTVVISELSKVERARLRALDL